MTGCGPSPRVRKPRSRNEAGVCIYYIRMFGVPGPPQRGREARGPSLRPSGGRAALEPLSGPFSPPAAGRGRGGVGPQEPTKGGVSRFLVPPPSLRLPDRLQLGWLGGVGAGGEVWGLGGGGGLKPVNRPVLAAPRPPAVLPASSPSAARRDQHLGQRRGPRATAQTPGKHGAEIGAWPGPWGLRPPGRFLTCSDHNYFLFNVKIVLYYLLNVA